MILSNPAETALTELTRVPWVRFAVLALSSVFLLMEPFRLSLDFGLAEGADSVRRWGMACVVRGMRVDVFYFRF